MANLTITVPDAAIARIQAAFGHTDSTVAPAVVTLATLAEIREAIKGFVRSKVQNYESNQAASDSVAASDVRSW